jgi:hypothetical protein
LTVDTKGNNSPVNVKSPRRQAFVSTWLAASACLTWRSWRSSSQKCSKILVVVQSSRSPLGSRGRTRRGEPVYTRSPRVLIRSSWSYSARIGPRIGYHALDHSSTRHALGPHSKQSRARCPIGRPSLAVLELDAINAAGAGAVIQTFAPCRASPAARVTISLTYLRRLPRPSSRPRSRLSSKMPPHRQHSADFQLQLDLEHAAPTVAQQLPPVAEGYSRLYLCRHGQTGES